MSKNKIEIIQPTNDDSYSLSEQVKAYKQTIFQFLGCACLLGIILGIIWRLVVKLPKYLVHKNLTASIGQSGIADYASADAWFSILAVIGGLAIGIVGWILFNRLGWITPILVVVISLLTGLICWRIGLLVAPSPFSERLAAASAGDLIEIDFRLRAKVAIFVWPFFTILPVMLAATFFKDPKATNELADKNKDDQDKSLAADTNSTNQTENQTNSVADRME